MVPFKCDVHGWMNAYVGVLEHPYFAVTDKDGKFTLKGLPPGTYTIEAWHEKLGTQTARSRSARRKPRTRTSRSRRPRPPRTRQDRQEGLDRREGSRTEVNMAFGPPVPPLLPLPPLLPIRPREFRAPPLCDVRRRLHRPARPRGQPGHQHRLGTVGSRLADHLRLEHVLVPAVQVGRRHPLRTRPPAHRQHGRLPHDHPRRVAGVRAIRAAG